MSYVRVSGGYAHGASLADSCGGGIYLSGKQARLGLSHCLLSGNRADSHGGGIYVNGSATLSNCTLRGNKTGDHGGGLYVTAGTAIIEDCAVKDNDAVRFSFSGVGAYNGGNMHVLRCVITGNRTENDGGGVGYWNSNGTVTQTVIAKNYSADTGGGVYCGKKTDVVIKECSIYDNHAVTDGGGLSFWNDGKTVVTHCTITGNTTGDGGGGAISHWEQHRLELLNSIAWGNTAPDLLQKADDELKARFSLAHGVAGPGVKHGDPLFVDAEAADYSLQSGSPARDSADPDSPPDPDRSPADMGRRQF